MKRNLSAYSHIFFYYHPEFTAIRRHFKRRFQKSSLTTSYPSDRLSDVTPVLFLHRIAESVSPPNLILVDFNNTHPIFYPKYKIHLSSIEPTILPLLIELFGVQDGRQIRVLSQLKIKAA